MAGPVEAIISALLGRAPNPGTGGSPYPTDYMSNRGQMKMMGANPDPVAELEAMIAQGEAARGRNPPTGNSVQGPGAGPMMRPGLPPPGPPMPRARPQMPPPGSYPGASRSIAPAAPLPPAEMASGTGGMMGGGANSILQMLGGGAGGPVDRAVQNANSQVLGIPSDAVSDVMATGPIEAEVIDVDPGSKKHGGIRGDSVYDPDTDEFGTPPNTAMAAADDDEDIESPVTKVDEAEASPAETGGSRTKTVTVMKNDSLWRIAEKAYGTKDPTIIRQAVKSIQEMNGIDDPNVIQPGQQLKVPANGVPNPQARGKGRESNDEFG